MKWSIIIILSISVLNINCTFFQSPNRLLFYPTDSSEFTLDPNTAHGGLILSKHQKRVTMIGEEQSYQDHPDRFDSRQVLCRQGLTESCYWEVEWKGEVYIGVAYRGITRKKRGDSGLFGRSNQVDASWLGGTNKSWSLYCYGDRCCAWHNNTRTKITVPFSGSDRVGVYVDLPAGTLSFYSVSPGVAGSSDTLTHIHTFQSTFTHADLVPGLGLTAVVPQWPYISFS